MSENLRDFIHGVFVFDAVVQRADPARWADQSPCEYWTARHVVDHNVFVANMIANMCSGTPATVPEDSVEKVIPAPGGGGFAMNPVILKRFIGKEEDPVPVWNEHRDRVLEALDQAGALHRETRSPFGHPTVEDFLGFAKHDPVVHAWDLGQAVGLDAHIPDALAQKALDALVGAEDLLPIRQGLVFAEASAAERDDPLSKLIAFAGR